MTAERVMKAKRKVGGERAKEGERGGQKDKNSKSKNKKRWHCPRHELTLLTLAFPSPALLADAPPSVLENVVAQFAKILPSDAKARKQFVTSGGLKKVGPTISASAACSHTQRESERHTHTHTHTHTHMHMPCCRVPADSRDPGRGRL